MSKELEDKLRSMKVSNLKKEISKTNVRGYSKLKKEEVIKFMLANKKRFMYLVNQDKQFITKGGKKFPIGKKKPKKKDEEKPEKKEEEKPEKKQEPEKKEEPDDDIDLIIKQELESLKKNKKKQDLFTKSVNELIVNDFANLAYTKDANQSSSFICRDVIESYVFLKVLEKNKNDCIFFPRENESDRYNLDDGLGIDYKELRQTDMLNRIAEKYQSCRANEKILAILVNYDSHENLITINPYLNTVEYYEPHGQAQDNEEKYKKEVSKLMRNFVRQINKNLSEGEKLKYVPPTKSCPRITNEIKKKLIVKSDINGQFLLPQKYVGLQAIAGLDYRKTGRIKTLPPKNEDKYFFNKTSGFCCMWSLLQLDFRLKNPELPPNELSTLLLKKFKDDPVNLTHKFIVAYAESFMRDLVKNIRGGYNTLGDALIDKFGDVDKDEGLPTVKDEKDEPSVIKSSEANKLILDATQDLFNKLVNKIQEEEDD